MDTSRIAGTEFLAQDFAVHRFLGRPWQGFVQHNEIHLAFHDEGWHEILRGGERLKIPSRRLAVMWGIVPYRSLRLAPATTATTVTIPLPWFLQWDLSDVLTAPLLHGRFLCDPQESNSQADAAAFQRWLKYYAHGTPEHFRVILLEVEARLRRLALDMNAASAQTFDLGEKRGAAAVGSSAHHDSHSTPVEFDKVSRMVRYIATHYAKPIKSADIARAGDLHMTYAMALFRRTCGVTFGQYLTQHRIWHTQRLLATTDSMMHEIAEEAGFGSVSQFHAVFKRSCGRPPHSYRASLRRHSSIYLPRANEPGST